jgi:hypothetical protein
MIETMAPPWAPTFRAAVSVSLEPYYGAWQVEVYPEFSAVNAFVGR